MNLTEWQREAIEPVMEKIVNPKAQRLTSSLRRNWKKGDIRIWVSKRNCSFRHYIMPNRLLYIIRAESTGDYKIGLSHNVLDRLSTLQQSNSQKLELILVVNGGEELERALFMYFEQYHIRHEWFSPNPELEEWIKEVQKLTEWKQERQS